MPLTNHSDRGQRATFALLKQISLGIAKLFAPHCEVVIHDFRDLERSIIHIEGNISGRKVGGGATDLLLTQARNGNTARDFHNYQTVLAQRQANEVLHDVPPR